MTLWFYAKLRPPGRLGHAYWNPGGNFSMAGRERDGEGRPVDQWQRFDPATGVNEGRCYVRKPDLHSIFCWRREEEH